jgi:hypothetical protein
MALRMINGSFRNLKIDRYGKEDLQAEKKSTTIECWLHD